VYELAIHQAGMNFESALAAFTVALIFVTASGFAVAWWLRGRSLEQLRWECDRLQAALERKEDSLARTLARCDELQGELGGLHDKLGHDETQIGQLRDLVKIHVARRREFDEWANPIRASLGDAVGHTMRTLKEQMTRQEFAIRRQERIVAEAEAQYRGKHDELEGMRRELTLKNYHIAALNERFIRVEERMHELTTQVAAIGASRPGARLEAELDAASPAHNVTPVSPETERFSLDKAESRDWMQVLDDWHRQLHDRLDRMDDLQSQLRASGARSPGSRNAGPGSAGDAGAA
jgi:chromosome segregation ATPase